VNLRADDSNTTLRKARNWITRWKLIGGCFQVAIGANGVEVTIARVADDSETIAATQATAANALELELAASPDTHTMICALVRAAWTEQHRIRPANDDPAGPPEAA
jgi:hypothetical protein